MKVLFVNTVLISFLNFISLGLIPGTSLAQDPKADAPASSYSGFEEAFQQGVKLYLAQKYKDAETAFTKALEFEPENVQALTNLGLSHFQNGNKGMAVALLRKALHLDPAFSTPRSALQFILPQLEVKEIPHEISYWESFRTQMITPFSSLTFSLLATLFLCAAGWTIMNFFSARAKAKLTENLGPQFPLLGGFYAFGFLLFTALLAGKLYDETRLRGTIVETKVPVVSFPDEKAPTLFDLYSGMEVIILQSDTEWSQVYYPGGMAGWIRNKAIFNTQAQYSRTEK